MNKSQKGFVVPLLVGIIAVLVIGGGVYVYENNKVKVPVVNIETQQSNQAQQTNTQNTPVANQPVIKVSPISSPVSVKSSITISTPNGQEVWLNGSQQTIRWTSKGSDATQPVEINLERKSPTDTQFWNIGTIATNQPGSGSYKWTVSSKDTNGSVIANSQYKILIGRNMAKGTGSVDESDSYFLIATPTTQPDINIISPNAGETWQRKSTQNIQWAGFSGEKISIYIKIPCQAGYTCDTFKPYNGNFTVASNIPNNGSYSWNVGQTIECGSGDTDACPVPNTDYSMKICTVDQQLCVSKSFVISN